MTVLRAAAIAVALIFFLVIAVPARKAQAALGLASRLPIWFCRTLCVLLRITVIECGGPPGRAHPTLIISNHVSWTDVIALGARRSQCFLAKQEVASWPVFGALARAQGCVFLDRGRRMRIPQVNGRIADRLLARVPVVLFAEATTSDGTRVRRFHSSHVAAAGEALRRDADLARVIVQPTAIVYRTRRGLPLGRSGRSTVAWYGDMDFWPSLAALLRNGPITCEIAYGAPMDFVRGQDRKATTRQAEARVRELVNRILTGRARALDLSLARGEPPQSPAAVETGCP